MTLVQGWTTASNTNNASTDVAVTWGGSRTSGNLLILIVNSDTTQSTPTGWTLGKSQVNDSGGYIFWRIADNSATDSPTFTANFSTVAAYAEFSGNTATPNDVSTSAGTSTASNAAFSTGTTGATAQANELAVACWGYSATQVQLANGGGNIWSSETNSFSEVVDIGTTKASGTNVGLCVATKNLTGTGTQESTATPSITSARVALIMTFKESAGGGAASPNRRNYNVTGNLTSGFSGTGQ